MANKNISWREVKKYWDERRLINHAISNKQPEQLKHHYVYKRGKQSKRTTEKTVAAGEEAQGIGRAVEREETSVEEKQIGVDDNTQTHEDGSREKENEEDGRNQRVSHGARAMRQARAGEKMTATERKLGPKWYAVALEKNKKEVWSALARIWKTEGQKEMDRDISAVVHERDRNQLRRLEKYLCQKS